MSEEFLYKDVINLCPYPVIAVDNQQTIQLANAAFSSLTGLDDEQLAGASADASTLPALQALLGDSDHIKYEVAGEGVIFLERVSRSTTLENGQGLQVHYYQFIKPEDTLQQENVLLRQKVEKLTLTDELTGLANERALSQQLAIQVSRSRRYQNPLTLAMVSMEIMDENYPHILDDDYDKLVVAFSRFLRDRLRWADFIARCTAGRFVIVLPETTEKEAHKLFQAIAEEAGSIDIPDAEQNPIRVQFGLAEWQKGNDPKLLVERASVALNQEA